jgi:hypothetical protein
MIPASGRNNRGTSRLSPGFIAPGFLSVEGGLSSLAESVIPALPEEAGVGVRMAANAAKKLIGKGVALATAACGLASAVEK